MTKEKSYKKIIKSYSIENLKEILRSIDKGAYPDRYQELVDEILRREPGFSPQAHAAWRDTRFGSSITVFGDFAFVILGIGIIFFTFRSWADGSLLNNLGLKILIFLWWLCVVPSALLEMRKASMSAQWEKVGGKVLACRKLWVGRGIIAALHYIVNYEFGPNGKLGSRVRFGHWFNSKAIAEKYPPGREVKVYVNPTDDSDCVLEPGFQARHHLLNFFNIAISTFLLMLTFL